MSFVFGGIFDELLCDDYSLSKAVNIGFWLTNLTMTKCKKNRRAKRKQALKVIDNIFSGCIFELYDILLGLWSMFLISDEGISRAK